MVAEILTPKMVKGVYEGATVQAKEHNTTFDKIQFSIALDAEAEDGIRYNVNKEGQFISPITLKKILNTKVDIMGICGMLPPYLVSALKQHAAELGIEESQIRAWFYPQSPKQLRICIYNFDTYVKDVSFDELVNITI